MNLVRATWHSGLMACGNGCVFVRSFVCMNLRKVGLMMVAAFGSKCVVCIRKVGWYSLVVVAVIVVLF